MFQGLDSSLRWIGFRFECLLAADSQSPKAKALGFGWGPFFLTRGQRAETLDVHGRGTGNRKGPLPIFSESHGKTKGLQ